jgi:hypothetical protein
MPLYSKPLRRSTVLVLTCHSKHRATFYFSRIFARFSSRGTSGARSSELVGSGPKRPTRLAPGGIHTDQAASRTFASSRCHQFVTRFSEGFSSFVTSIAAPVASGWSVCRVGLTPTGKRRLSRRTPYTDIRRGPGLQTPEPQLFGLGAYSITSSARPSRLSGNARPNDLVGPEVDDQPNFHRVVDRQIGRSASAPA